MNTSGRKGRKGSKRSGNKKLLHKKLIIPALAVIAASLTGILWILQVPNSSIQNTEYITQSESDGDSPSVIKDDKIDTDTDTDTDTRTDENKDTKTGKTSTKVSSAAQKAVKESTGRLYIVIDDVGNNLDELSPFLKLPFPLTFAVMPGRPYTDAAITGIKSNNKVFIIHQPMEPIGDANPGPKAVLSNMTEQEIKDLIRSNIEDMPGALGMNNHMGSKITADTEKLTYVLQVLKEHKLIFIDSVTNAQTKGESVAANTGTAFSKRNTMFLDNDKDRESIEEMITAAKGVAAKQGYAVMIGHVWSSELADLLLELYPSLLDDGYELKDVRDLLTQGSPQ